ncbi:MAG: hypothetical protein MJ174_05845 [Treponema sp.]|nr:hypothetical protein [Treponema sp.]
MSIFNNLVAKAKATTTKAAETFDNAAKSINTDKIRWIPIEKISIDPEIKAIFNQNETEIHNISEDMKVNGYNAGNPTTVSQDNVLVEGHTRYLAALRAGIKKIAVVYKHFNSKQEMLEYAYKQQLHRRNLSEQDIFNAYLKLRELTNEDGKKAKTDVQIAEELHVSPRQIAKMKEVERKASSEVMTAFNEGAISLNQAYNQMKEEIKPAEEKVEVQETISEAPAEPKVRKTSSEKPFVEKLNLKFKPEDFVLLQNAAEAANLSVTDYVMKLVMSNLQTIPEADTVSEKETA